MREDIKINDRALALEDQIIEVLEKVYDTDVELDVYNLGLIYEIHLDEAAISTLLRSLEFWFVNLLLVWDQRFLPILEKTGLLTRFASYRLVVMSAWQVGARMLQRLRQELL